MAKITALIFDLDGVIVDTARYHFLAWRRLAKELGIEFGEKENEQLKGVSRKESLEKILSWGGVSLDPERFEAMMHQKNVWYLEYMDELNPQEILPGVVRILDKAKELNLKIALGSASKNAPLILEKTALTHFFDEIVDGNVVEKSKPDPEVFLKGAQLLGVDPKECIVFEDSKAGIEAAINGNMMAVAIGDAEELAGAHLQISSFENKRLEEDIIDQL